MIAWGLDLSLANTGISIYDTEKQETLYIGSVDTDFIRRKKDNKHLYLNAIKLKHIYEEMNELKKKYPPQVVVIERGFSRFNTATQVIYRVHGITNLLFHDVDQKYYPPKSVKEALVHGSATKEDLQIAINAKYNDISFVNEDESDSFAVLLTHLAKEGLINWDKPKWSDIKKMRKPKK